MLEAALTVIAVVYVLGLLLCGLCGSIVALRNNPSGNPYFKAFVIAAVFVVSAFWPALGLKVIYEFRAVRR